MTDEEEGRWLFAIAKHLKIYAQDSSLASLYAIRTSAREGELLLRLRGLRKVGVDKLRAFALDVGIAAQELRQTISRLESTRLVTADRPGHNLQFVTETILTEREVYRATSKLFRDAEPSPVERTILPLIEALSQLPYTENEVVQHLCLQGCSEEDARQAIEFEEAFGLIRRQTVSDFGQPLLFNDYLWGHKIERIGPVLAGLGGYEVQGLRALIEEVRTAQGRSVDQLTAAAPHIIQMAMNTGILDTTTIITSKGDQKAFAFSPHFYGYKAGKHPAHIPDTADQVKLMVASIAYGVNHSVDFRLHSPIAFLHKLVHDGEAGSATPILRDYPLLELQGIVRVEERHPGRGTFIVQKEDIVKQALDVLISGSILDDDGASRGERVLIEQRKFRSPEENRIRARIGETTSRTERLDHDLIAAIREAAQGGIW